MTAKCVVCNKDFERTHHSKTICSPECKKIKKNINYKKYYENNRDTVISRVKKYKNNNEQKVKESKEEYRKNNIEKIRKDQRDSYSKNKEPFRESAKRYISTKEGKEAQKRGGKRQKELLAKNNIPSVELSIEANTYYKKWDLIEIEEMLEMAYNKISLKDMAKKLNRTVFSVRSKLDKIRAEAKIIS